MTPTFEQWWDGIPIGQPNWMNIASRKFAATIRAAAADAREQEREACAKVAETCLKADPISRRLIYEAGHDIASAIRNRGSSNPDAPPAGGGGVG